MSHDPNSKSGKSSGTGKDRSRSIIDSQVPAAPPALKPDTATNADAAASTQPKSVTAPSPVIRTLGRYTILGELGRGGMGAVYLAEDSVLKRKVALKIPQFEPSNAAQFQARFLREAQMAAQLSHPNICRVHDVGVIDGQYVMAMEYIDGRTFAAFTSPEKLLAERQAVLLVKKVALAVEVAHQKGMIHRDLKPGNIMLPKATTTRKTIEPKVMDFGLAKSMDSRTAELTKSGMIVGTPCYMSKEQWSGKDAQLGPPCDVYSLGIILYELLTGKLPYDVEEGEPATAWFVKLITEPQRRVSERKPNIDAALEAIVMKAIAKESADRFASMAEFASALNAWLKPDMSPQSSETSAVSGFEFPGSAGPEVLPADPRPARSRVSRPPIGKFLQGGMAGAVLLLLGIVIWFRFGNQLVRVEILADGFDVTFKEAEIRIADGVHETRVQPGHHTLHIKSRRTDGDSVVQEFDTEQFTLKNGDKPVIRVTLEPDAIVAALDGRAIARQAITASPDIDKSSPPADPVSGQEKSPLDKPSSTDVVAAAKPLDLKPGVWIKLLDTKMEPSDASRVKLTDGVLELNDTSVKFPEILAKDIVFRAKIKRLDRDKHLTLNVRDSARGGYLGYHSYNAVGKWVGIAKWQGTWNDIRFVNANIGSDFTEMSMEARGNQLNLSVEGKTVVAVTDSSFTEGSVGISAHLGRAQFKDLEVMILDSPPAAKPPDVVATTINQVPVAKSLKGHKSGVIRLAFTPDGTRILSAGDDGEARLWSVDSGETLHVFNGHKGSVTSLAVSGDGTQALTGGADRTVRWLDLTNGTEIAEFRGHGSLVHAVAFIPGGHEAISAAEDQSIWHWNLDTKADVGHFEVRSIPPTPKADTLNQMGARFNKDGTRLLLSGYNGTVHLIDTVNKSDIATFQSWGRDMAFSPDETRFVSGAGRDLSVWDIQSKNRVCQFQGDVGECRGIAFTPDGRRVVTSSWDATSRVWDIATQTELGRIGEVSQRNKNMVAVAVSPDGKWAASGGWTATIHLWPLSWIDESK